MHMCVYICLQLQELNCLMNFISLNLKVPTTEISHNFVGTIVFNAYVFFFNTAQQYHVALSCRLHFKSCSAIYGKIVVRKPMQPYCEYWQSNSNLAHNGDLEDSINRILYCL